MRDNCDHEGTERGGKLAERALEIIFPYTISKSSHINPFKFLLLLSSAVYEQVMKSTPAESRAGGAASSYEASKEPHRWRTGTQGWEKRRSR